MTAQAPVKPNSWVDTNIWFYALSSGDEAKRLSANHLLDSIERPVVNSQVIRELCINLLKKSSYDEAAIQELATSLYRDCHVAPECIYLLGAKERMVRQAHHSNRGCQGEDLNLHPVRDTLLKRARIPFRHLGLEVIIA